MKIAAQLNKLLSRGISGNQLELVDLLKQQGVQTTQSSVSRALKKINAIRGIDEAGNTIYSLPQTSPAVKETGFFDSLVHRILDNGNMIVIHTRPGTASTVAKFIDDYQFDEVMGTIAGDDTIMIAPVNVLETQAVAQKVGAYLKELGIY